MANQSKLPSPITQPLTDKLFKKDEPDGEQKDSAETGQDTVDADFKEVDDDKKS